jgi:hypothetical protein
VSARGGRGTGRGKGGAPSVYVCWVEGGASKRKFFHRMIEASPLRADLESRGVEYRWGTTEQVDGKAKIPATVWQELYDHYRTTSEPQHMVTWTDHNGNKQTQFGDPAHVAKVRERLDARGIPHRWTVTGG